MLKRKLGLEKLDKKENDNSNSIELSCDVFNVKLEKYRREIYITLYKSGHIEDEINLFNILQYIKKDSLSKVPVSNFFSEEKRSK